MRTSFAILLVALIAAPAFAELENVEVGGSIRIRGNYYSPEAGFDSGPRAANPLISTPWAPVNALGLRWEGNVPRRAIGRRAGLPMGIYSWDEGGNSFTNVEQRTTLNVKADFTGDVSAFIELDSYDVWGEDFRSGYITGADMRGSTNIAPATDGDVEVYQAYIEANEMWGYPLSMRIGRQEIIFGSGWLLGTNDVSSMFTGLSLDGVLLTYATDVISVNALWAKLGEMSPAEEDGDIDLYAIYASYLALEDITIDAYWLLIRDARMLAPLTGYNGFIDLTDTLENWFGVDDYSPTYLNTIGLRGAGAIGAFDIEAEIAYQFGDADQIGWLFQPLGRYADDDADFDEWGMNLEVGYTFDMNYQPRIYLGLAYFGGEDNRDLTFAEWLRSFFPFYEPEASVSFNRLLSNWEYSEFIDNTALSNCWVLRGGVSASLTENVEVLLALSYFETVDEFDDPLNFRLFGRRYALLSMLPFLSNDNDDELGWELGLYVTYHYTEDLTFEAGWAHLFVDDGLEDGNYSAMNGLGFNGGTDDDDADYLYLETKIAF